MAAFTFTAKSPMGDSLVKPENQPLMTRLYEISRMEFLWSLEVVVSLTYSLNLCSLTDRLNRSASDHCPINYPQTSQKFAKLPPGLHAPLWMILLSG